MSLLGDVAFFGVGMTLLKKVLTVKVGFEVSYVLKLRSVSQCTFCCLWIMM